MQKGPQAVQSVPNAGEGFRTIIMEVDRMVAVFINTRYKNKNVPAFLEIEVY